MRSNKEIRLAARQELKGFWTMPVLATLVYYLINSVCQGANFFTQLGSVSFRLCFASIYLAIAILVLVPLEYGFQLAFLHFLREDKEDTVEQIFCGFKTYGRAIGVTLLQMVFIFLWSMLLIIPGIVKFFSYAMTVFISKDHPELSANECIDRSMDMMNGHKMQLFLMYLGFVGLTILSVFTLFIGLLWLIPYMQVCVAEFYENLKAEEEIRLAEEDALMGIVAEDTVEDVKSEYYENTVGAATEITEENSEASELSQDDL